MCGDLTAVNKNRLDYGSRVKNRLSVGKIGVEITDFRFKSDELHRVKSFHMQNQNKQQMRELPFTGFLQFTSFKTYKQRYKLYTPTLLLIKQGKS